MIENKSSRDDERAAEYRSAIFEAVAPANWREILETAASLARANGLAEESLDP
jgi:hypothetical protein